MSLVALQGVHKAYGTHVVLGAVDLAVPEGERIGVVGQNGAGKSTLARILAGSETPDAGNVARRRGVSVSFLDQVPRFEGDPTAYEAVLGGLAAWGEAMARHEAVSLAIERGDGKLEELLERQHAAAADVERLGGWERSHHVNEVLGHLGISRRDARVGTLSGGEQRRVALARILISRPELAVLDEPTNHLDADTIAWLETHLIEEYPGAVVLITHDRYLLDRVATRTVELADGALYDYQGGYELYLEQKAERLAHAQRTEQNRQNFLRRELEWLRRQPKARSTKQKARIDRAEAAKGVAAPKLERTAKLDLDVVRSGKTILELHSLGVEIGGSQLVKGLDFFLTEGERVGIVGPNGSGKTTLLRVLLGELEPAAGSVVLGQRTRIAYFDQQRSGLDDSKSVFENVTGDVTAIELGGEVVEPRTYLERFAFDGHKQRQPVGSLSGGERARVALARLLRSSANLVILDEPTNDLDVATLSALESMLVDFGVTALVVTHDRWFLDRVATGILAFEGAAKVVRYPGNYSTFLSLRAEMQAQAAKPAAPEPPERRAPKASKAKGLTFAEERELEGLFEAITAAESKVTELTATLADPRTYAEGGKDAGRLSADLAEAKAQVERLSSRWEELESRKGG